jgi:hypothetical protein
MPRALALLLISVAACKETRKADWTKVAGGQEGTSELKLPLLIPDAQLKTFLPERLGGRLGQFPQGTMTRMGDRALSEASRDYRGGAPSETGPVQLKIADAWLEPRATQAIRSLADTDFGAMGGGSVMGSHAIPERLVLPGGVGYARYDEGARLAQAQVLIGGRFIASATVAQAEDAQDAAQALRALDTLALARLAQAQ